MRNNQGAASAGAWRENGGGRISPQTDRKSAFRLRSRWWLVSAVVLGPCVWLAQAGLGKAAEELRAPPPIPLAEGRKLAAELVGNLLRLKPTENSTNTGTVKIRNREGNERQFPVAIIVVPTSTNFVSIYENLGSADASGGMRLSIVHTDGGPDEYFLSQPITAVPRKLGTNELNIPFAGSDFWAVDLGLEFFHWPDQRVVRKQMRKNLFCDQLVSTNPHPSPGGYSRVESWIAANRPDEMIIVHADAFDMRGRPLKLFDPKKVEKVNGAWQLEEMEILNRRTGSRTIIKFNLDQPSRTETRALKSQGNRAATPSRP